MKVKVGISNHHVHLKKEDLEKLFGIGFELENVRDLIQPYQFVSNSFVNLVGPKGSINHVRVLGPIRDYTQVEISKTDSYTLGINPPIRESGDLQSSSPIKLIGPKGEIELEEGCIIPNRHIHLTNDDVDRLNLNGIRKVKIKIDNEKGGIIDNVYLKVSDDFKLECHLDTDDGNGNLLNNGDEVEICID